MKFCLLLAVIIQLAASIFPASCLEYFPCMIFFLVDPGQFRIAKKKSSKTKTFLLGGISTINLPVLRVNLRAWETREWNKTRRRNSRADYSPPHFASGGQKSFFFAQGNGNDCAIGVMSNDDDKVCNWKQSFSPPFLLLGT